MRGYEQAGVTAIQIEDQEFPKKCGHTPDRRVVPIDDMVRKIQVASDSRSSSDFLIIARTDARTGKGLDEAIRRGVAYAEAGADIIFVESPESEAKNWPKSAAGSASRCSPTWSTAAARRCFRLTSCKALGFSIAIYPAVGFLVGRRGVAARLYGSASRTGPRRRRCRCSRSPSSTS